MGSLRTKSQDHEYTAPVRQLLSLGEIGNAKPDSWPNYAKAYGLHREHSDELIRMACDMALHKSQSDSNEVWAPVHAWRALAQWQVAAAVPPLLALAAALDDDTMDIELPIVLCLIGPAAVPHIARLLSDRSTPQSAAMAVIPGIGEIGTRHPQCRTDCIGVLTRVLEQRPGMDKRDPVAAAEQGIRAFGAARKAQAVIHRHR